MFRRIADEIFRRDGKSVHRLRSNLHRVRPDLADDALDALTHEAVRSYLRYWCESFRLPAWPIEDVVRRTRTVDEHHLRDAYAQGRGVVVPLPHMANWDWAGAWACATGMPLTTVAERLEPERLYDGFVPTAPRSAWRSCRSPAATRRCPRLEGGCARADSCCLLADRDLSPLRRRGRLCGAPRPDAARAGAAGPADRRAPGAGDPGTTSATR